MVPDIALSAVRHLHDPHHMLRFSRTNAAIVDRLCQLEARVEELEYSSTSRSPSTLVDGVIQQQQQGSSAPSPLSNHKKGRRASTKPSVSALEHSNTPTDPRSSQHTLPTVNTNGQLVDGQGDPHGLSTINGITVDGQDESQDIKQDEAYSAANCETEEAALALESLCKTGDVLDRNTHDSTRGSFSLPSVVNPSVLSLDSNNQRLPGISTILPGPLSILASGSKPLEANESQTRVNSPTIRQHRSTIVVDPATHGVTSTTTTSSSSSSTTSNNSIGGHRLQRSLEARLRILTSSNFPSKEFCDYVTGNYFRYLDPLWHVHIGWLFDDEYKAFWKLRNEGRFMEIDPAWGALFFMTLALGESYSRCRN